MNELIQPILSFKINFIYFKFIIIFFWGICFGQPKLTPVNHNNVPWGALDSYQVKMAGYTQSDFERVQIGNISYNTNISNWKLTVQATGNYTGSGSGEIISVGYTSLQFEGVSPGNMVPSSSGPLALSLTEQVLINGAPAINPNISGYFIEYQFLLNIQGGNHLLVNTGRYSTSIIFRLYDGNNQLIDQVVQSDFGFQINNSGQGGNSELQVRNGGGLVEFSFNNPMDYQTGKSVQKSASVYAKSFSRYQILVKAGGPELLSSNSTDAVAVNLFQIEAGQSLKNLPYLEFNGPIKISDQEQILLKNQMNNYNYQEVEYDLNYSISGQDSMQLLDVFPSTYSGILYFIMIPL